MLTHSERSVRAAAGYIKGYVAAYVLLSMLGILINMVIRVPIPSWMNSSGGNFSLADEIRIELSQWIYVYIVDYHFKAFIVSAFTTLITGILLYLAFKALKLRIFSLTILAVYLVGSVLYTSLPLIGFSMSSIILQQIYSAVYHASNLSEALRLGAEAAYTSFPLKEMLISSAFIELGKNASLATGYLGIKKVFSARLSLWITLFLVTEGVYAFLRFLSIPLLWEWGNYLQALSFGMLMVTAIRLLLQWSNANHLRNLHS